MNPQLENDTRHRSAILAKVVALAEHYFEQQPSLSPGREVTSSDVQNLPDEGIGAERTLELFERKYAHLVNNSAGPRYFGFVTGGSTPAAVAGDWLVSAYDQNACGSNDSVAPWIEHQTIHFFRNLFGLDTGYYGSFVTGATMANFVGLALGRQWAGEQYGVDASNDGLRSFPVRVVSATPHSSIVKAMSMLGIGRNALCRIDTLPDRECIDVGKLQALLTAEASPVIVVANAGTVNTVDFDDLEAIGKLKSKHNFWLHVDAAFGGFAACSPKFSHVLNGLHHADSITVDAHKWLNVPYDSGMQFTRHQDLQLKVFQNSAAYLGDPQESPDFFHYTPENSRRWRALPSWFSLVAYGRAGYREIVERNCALAHELGERISNDNDFRLLSPVRMNVVCFTLRHAALTFEMIRSFLAAIRDDGQVFFTPTLYKGTPAIRAAVSNWQTETDDIRTAWESLKKIRRKWVAPDDMPADINTR